MIWSPVDKYLAEMDGNVSTGQSPAAKKLRGRTALTGNQHLHMVRDHFSETFKLYRGDEDEVQIDETHFQPIFFAKDVESLRGNFEAQRALRKYRIFVGPDEIEAAIEESKQKVKL